ncbi:replication factor C subunit 1 [Helicoverpa zea]|uniref:replication factor C subunit 1 n=1 Tax=Helicoverpa zea TaxID=7113 RepID=UPI001F5635E6|nr:replication factor C subunit 1 [Helicoverpa zea]
MSRDIRSFFSLKKPAKPAAVVEDDDDVIPESPDVQIIKNKKKDSKKKRVLNDSDEEIFTTKKKKTTDEAQTSSKNKNKSPKPALKEVKAVDIFGSAPIKRTEPLVKKKKKTELGIHSDDEFEKSLLEIDNAELEGKANNEKADDKSEKSTKTSNASKDRTEDSKKSTEKFDDKKHKSSSNTDSNKDLKKTDESKPSKKTEDTKSLKKSESTEPKQNNDKDHTKVKKDHKSPKIDKFIQSNLNQSSIDSNEGENTKSKIDKSKRKFAEFLETDTSQDHSSKKKKLNESMEAKLEETKEYDCDSSVLDDEKGSHKKKKMNKSLNESVLTDEERHERRIHSAALYKNYLNRSGPKHLGAKEIPEGKPDCLKDCAFLLTGVLDSFEKDEIAAAITKYGGCVKSGVSKKVTHVLAGEDAGPAKMAKAQELGIKIINEDEFLAMITERSQGKPTSKPDIKKEIKKEKTPNKKDKSDKDRKDNHVDSKSKKSPTDKVKMEPKSKDSNKLDVSKSKNREKSKSPRKIKEEKMELESETRSSASSSSSSLVNGNVKREAAAIPANMSMWVEKYKPQNIKQIIGQHGDASNVKKLMNWLTKWYVNRKAKLPKPSPWAKNDDGGYFKAALLSGPPGVGKTTTVSLVCKELGFDMVEFNASDTRNKTLIKEQIGELLTSTSLSAYAKGDTGKQAVTKKHVLVMDEVDGMAGNEDRGGLQELIALIKSSSVPIICMCNDRNSQKMRSLVNYCYDLRFSKPRVDQIKSAMLSICFKEGIKIPPDVLTQLIVSANQDVRQTLNLLSMWAVDPNRDDVDRLRKDAQTVRKDIKLGPWEAIRKVFSAEDHKKMSINDKSDLFFYDYSLAPLFVQENYLQVEPHCPKHEVLQRISKAADSISLGDLVDARIRSKQAWSLLPTQAMFSSVIPGHEMSGHLAAQIQFPGWLGKNSRATKLRRLCQEIHAHTRLSTSGSKSSIFLDYSTHLRDAIVNPLIKDKADGISRSLEVLESYHLLREDLDSLVELSVWPGQRNPTILVDPKVKAAMTRTYNKKATALPYAPGAVKKGKAKADDEDIGDEEQEEEDEEDSDPENDALIKKKKSKDTEKPTTSKASSKAPTSRKKKEK